MSFFYTMWAFLWEFMGKAALNSGWSYAKLESKNVGLHGQNFNNLPTAFLGYVANPIP